MPALILVINPGSTSTKIAVYSGDEAKFQIEIAHPAQELAKFHHIIEQLDLRKRIVLKTLEENGVATEQLSAVIGRGGLLKPIESGTYRVNTRMIGDLREAARGEHASNLGAILADSIAGAVGKPAFVADPVVVDELDAVARLSGLPEIERTSIFHALNQKRVARQSAAKLGKNYTEANLIVAHLGGGITVGAHRRGRVVDVNNGLDGEGPFTPERTGGLPVWDVFQLALSGKYTKDEFYRLMTRKGGLLAYLGTNSGKEVKERIRNGDSKAKLVYEAMAYQIAKEIGACATVLKGDVDAVVLTGGFARDEDFTGLIRERVAFIATVLIFPGEDEMGALAEAAQRILSGEEKAKEYV